MRQWPARSIHESSTHAAATGRDGITAHKVGAATGARSVCTRRHGCAPVAIPASAGSALALWLDHVHWLVVWRYLGGNLGLRNDRCADR